MDMFVTYLLYSNLSIFLCNNYITMSDILVNLR